MENENTAYAKSQTIKQQVKCDVGSVTGFLLKANRHFFRVAVYLVELAGIEPATP